MTTKEELDEAIAHLAGVFIPDSGAVETALTIITKYRDGELVEKSQLHELMQAEGGNDDLQSSYNQGWNDLIAHLTTPPTNQTEP